MQHARSGESPWYMASRIGECKAKIPRTLACSLCRKARSRRPHRARNQEAQSVAKICRGWKGAVQVVSHSKEDLHNSLSSIRRANLISTFFLDDVGLPQ